MVPCRASLASALGSALLLLASPQTAAGQSIETHEAAGVRFPRPRGFLEIPVPPLETNVVLRFVERPPSGRIGVVSTGKQVLFFSFGPGERTRTRSTPDVEHWLRRSGFRRREGALGRAETRHGYDVRTYESGIGPAWLFREGTRALAIVGLGWSALADGDPDESFDGWGYAIEEMRLLSPKAPETEKLAESYRRRGFSEPDYRARVQASLIRGWKFENTPNYIIVYRTGNQPFIKSIKSELEVMRAEYARIFPPAASLEKVSTVRICHDVSQYLAYGGPPGSGGFWSPQIRELVLFDNARRDGIANWTNEDTRRVLYHEAFHQYVHDAIGEFDPHMWFNEGLGDYFSGVSVKKGEVASSEPLPDRLEVIQKAMKAGATIPWDRFLLFDRETFYDPTRVDLCYAQAWSIVCFLMTAKAVHQDPEWREILPVYFDALKEVYSSELLRLGRMDALDDEEELVKAQEQARARAYEVAFSLLDLDELERAWREFVQDL